MGSKIIFKCGCEIAAEDRKAIATPADWTRPRVRCPEHFEEIDYILFKCENCGVIETLKSLNSLTLKKHCNDCRIKAYRATQKEKYDYFSQHCICCFEQCGCEYLRKDTVKKGPKAKAQCPVHGHTVTKVYSICQKCGARYQFKSGDSVLNCSDCMTTYRKRSTSWNWEKQTEVLTYSYDAARERASDCVHRDKCLIKYITRNVLPCRNCDDYVSSPLDILSYVYVGDSMGSSGRTRHGREWRGDRI